MREPETTQQLQTISYKDIQHLAFGFRHIVQIDHLDGLINLKKLQLDNNCLSRIENLDHLVTSCSCKHLLVQLFQQSVTVDFGCRST